jgi:hypothetical protein
MPASETSEAVAEWATDYCESADLSPCTGIEQRAVPMCIERRDCHPALLVPFDQGVAAFASGGIFPEPRVFAVWRVEADQEVAQYGGTRKLLEAYLLTIGVCPDARPGDENLGGDPRGPTCTQ